MRKTIALKFVRPEYGESVQEMKPYVIETSYPDDLEMHAEEFADYCFAARDGWEWTWPQTFKIYEGTTNKLLGKCEVSIESRPTFHAKVIHPRGPK